VVAVTLTDPAADEAIAASEPVVLDRPRDVFQAVIGEIMGTGRGRCGEQRLLSQ
jgi:hypothetical protein